MRPRIRYQRILILMLLSLCLVGCFVRDMRLWPVRPGWFSKPKLYALQTTGYCRCGKCCGWKRNWFFRPVVSSGPNKGQRKKVGRTASGAPAKDGTIAADTRIFPFGTIMYIPGYGYGKVEDRGSAIQGYHIDLYFGNHKKAQTWGNRKSRVKVWFPER